MTSERRKDPRVSCEMPASLKPALDPQTYHGRTVDLSRGGSLINSPIPLEEGSGLELRINLGEFTLAPVDGKVKRSNPVFYGHGHLVAVEFDDKTDTLMDAIVRASDSDS